MMDCEELVPAQMLEENTRLIQAISENQNLGKLDECSQ
jgi:hypothetical protein